MAIYPESVGAVNANDPALATPVDQAPAATPEVREEAQADVPAPTAEKVETPVETAKGPIPYARFEEVVRERQRMQEELGRLQQLQQIYALAESDPTQAAAAFDALAAGLRGLGQKAPEVDTSLMTETEQMLFREVQQLKAHLSQTARSTEAVQDQVVGAEMDEALTHVEGWAKEKGLPFDAEAVVDAMDSLNIERLVQQGKSTREIAMMAFKAATFDALPDVVRKQTYAEQMKKAGAQMVPSASRAGEPTQSVTSVRDAVEVAWRKHVPT